MGRERILVVEDYEPILSAIQDMLEMEGFTVLTAANGVEALQIMEDIHPDLILADILMPEMNGYDFYQAIRARPEWADIPFVFLTAKTGKGDEFKGRSLGADDYITKPFEPEDLLAAVRTWLAYGRGALKDR